MELKPRAMTPSEARNLAQEKFHNGFTVAVAMGLFALGLWTPVANRSDELETRVVPLPNGRVRVVTRNGATGEYTASEH